MDTHQAETTTTPHPARNRPAGTTKPSRMTVREAVTGHRLRSALARCLQANKDLLGTTLDDFASRRDEIQGILLAWPGVGPTAWAALCGIIDQATLGSGGPRPDPTGDHRAFGHHEARRAADDKVATEAEARFDRLFDILDQVDAVGALRPLLGARAGDRFAAAAAGSGIAPSVGDMLTKPGWVDCAKLPDLGDDEGRWVNFVARALACAVTAIASGRELPSIEGLPSRRDLHREELPPAFALPPGPLAIDVTASVEAARRWLEDPTTAESGMAAAIATAYPQDAELAALAHGTDDAPPMTLQAASARLGIRREVATKRSRRFAAHMERQATNSMTLLMTQRRDAIWKALSPDSPTIDGDLPRTWPDRLRGPTRMAVVTLRLEPESWADGHATRTATGWAKAG